MRCDLQSHYIADLVCPLSSFLLSSLLTSFLFTVVTLKGSSPTWENKGSGVAEKSILSTEDLQPAASQLLGKNASKNQDLKQRTEKMSQILGGNSNFQRTLQLLIQLDVALWSQTTDMCIPVVRLFSYSREKP